MRNYKSLRASSYTLQAVKIQEVWERFLLRSQKPRNSSSQYFQPSVLLAGC